MGFSNTSHTLYPPHAICPGCGHLACLHEGYHGRRSLKENCSHKSLASGTDFHTAKECDCRIKAQDIK